MRIRALIVVSLLVFSGTSVSFGDVVVPLTLGAKDSGWDAIVADNICNAVAVDMIGSNYVLIQITKIFTDPPSAGQYTPNLIRFHQRLGDRNTVGSIRIADESIFNYTGSDWTDYHWEIDGSAAAFNIAATDNSGFSVSPFTNETWGPPPTGWDANHASALNVCDGVVSNLSWFYPGSRSGTLHIDVDLGRQNSDFTLQQMPTPEPCSMVVLGCGGMLMFLRRTRTYWRRTVR